MSEQGLTKQVFDEFLMPHGITEDRLFEYIGKLTPANNGFADIYFQSQRTESWALEDGIVKNASFSEDQGIGFRVLQGERTGFSFTNQFSDAAINGCITSSKSIHNKFNKSKINLINSNLKMERYTPENIITMMKDRSKVELLSNIDQLARSIDPRVTEVQASLYLNYEYIFFCNSKGIFCGDIRPLVRLNLNLILNESGRREQGYVGIGGRYNLAQFETKIAKYEDIVREAIRIADINLHAIEAPSGEKTVVLGPGWAGILLHEAIGHGLEGDFIRKKTSAFSGLLGTNIASKLVTVIDDGTISGERGSLNIDDEGFQGAQTVLIENGKLVNFMQDQLNAGLMQSSQTGNGRRESYAHPPMPRMTNTCMLGGGSDPKEIISSVKEGIYAPGFSGGQVDITSGKFVFSTSEAYIIQEGKIKAPIKGAMLIGDGPNVLKQVSMVGNDFKLAPGIGICGKDGQSVPVGVGQPTIKIDKLTVGGTGLG